MSDFGASEMNWIYLSWFHAPSRLYDKSRVKETFLILSHTIFIPIKMKKVYPPYKLVLILFEPLHIAIVEAPPNLTTIRRLHFTWRTVLDELPDKQP
jgi:hypothetical protein